ncbi:uncharacterized protein LY89DRAFT_676495 [Mollisia scopiformis]|uniref:Uncharacterized protein n=1 Tax=Mollisia scopiformis TaxID=149040 RepID=A0A132B9S6_MOLSC|nr:uncharacterized protein LY89DRAFT_676495 [Mollisia scopiformis]KUJ09131.1 hypothetical protein LY89DRAFT_676495 [Mollisia scopiformis]
MSSPNGPDSAISNLCSSFLAHNVETKIVEKLGEAQCNTCYDVWYIIAICVMVLLWIKFHSEGRKQAIQELRNMPSYKLHDRLEEMYREEVASEKEVVQYIDRYHRVSHEDDSVRMRRTITIVEDLSRTNLPAVNPSREERATSPTVNPRTRRRNNSPVNANRRSRRSQTGSQSHTHSSLCNLFLHTNLSTSATESRSAPDLSLRQEEAARLVNPNTFRNSNNTSTAEISFESEDLETPPPYSPIIESVDDNDDDSDPEEYEIAHP